MVVTKKEYLSLIRYSCFMNAFINYYFLRMIVIYQLSNNVTTWVAVSIPIVFEFALMISRAMPALVEFASKVNYKKYHIFHLISFTLLGFMLTIFKDVYIIYFLTIIMGILTGMKYTSSTRLSVSNKKYESYCFVEEERSTVVGGTLGLLMSQSIYEISPVLYKAGYIVLLVIGTIMSFYLKNINTVIDEDKDKERKIEVREKLSKKERGETQLITCLYGILVGFWCMGWGAFNELVPLITTKVAYLESVYFVIEFVSLLFLTGKVLSKIKERNKLLLSEMIISLIDTSCLILVAFTLSVKGILIAYMIMALTAPLGDPMWGSIISSYSDDNDEKWIIVNKTYFIVRTIFTILTWFICKEIIINGIHLFKYLGIALLALLIVTYLIANKVNKKILNREV